MSGPRELGLRLLDAYIAIGGDTSGFDAALAQSEGKAKSSGERIAGFLSPSKVFGALAGAAGAAMGAGLSAALSGANELDAAMRQLQADTGMTDATAKLAEHSIAGMFQNNLQGIDQIGATLAVVINGLDLTGAAADAMTQKFLKFETATGQDSTAVSAFHEILNAWNLDASAAPGIMDLLVASHQKYGSVVTENQSALLAIAPAMQAMNMTIDDGIGLLNLFDVAGINAAKVPMALQFAIKQLKPGQTINDLIAQISSIQDPTLRAQAAMKAFGTRGGVQLAQAFQPGIVSIDQFKTSVTENTDAVLKADNAIRSTFGNQAVLLLHNFQGGLADMATSLGTSSDAILMAAALLGPKLATGILAVGGGLGGLIVKNLVGALTADVTPLMTAGEKIGKIMGGPLGLALGIAAVIGLAAYADDIQKALGSNYDPAKNLPLDQMSWPFGPKNTPKVDLGPFKNILGGDSTDQFNGAGRNDGGVYSAGVADGIDAKAPEVAAAIKGLTAVADPTPFKIEELFPLFGGSVQGVMNAAHGLGHTLGVEGMLAMAQGIESARKTPLDAYTTMLEMLKHEMTPQAEAARLAGELISTGLVRGLRSKDPEVRAQAIAAKEAILDRLAVIAQESGPLGKKAMDALAAGMKDADPTIRAYSKAAHDSVIAELDKTKTGALAAGVAAGEAFAAGIIAAISSKGVTRFISTGGTGKAGGLVYEGQANGGPVRAGVPYIVGEKRPELFIPETNGYILPSVPYVDRQMLTYVDRGQRVMSAQPGGGSPSGRGGGARDQTINIANVTLGDQHDEFSLAQGLRFLASVG